MFYTIYILYAVTRANIKDIMEIKRARARPSTSTSALTPKPPNARRGRAPRHSTSRVRHRHAATDALTRTHHVDWTSSRVTFRACASTPTPSRPRWYRRTNWTHANDELIRAKRARIHQPPRRAEDDILLGAHDEVGHHRGEREGF